MGAASGPCHGDRRPLGAGEGGWLALGSARAAWWDSGAPRPPGKIPCSERGAILAPLDPAAVAAAVAVPGAVAGSPHRACGSRAPLEENRPTSARRAAGGCPAPVPRFPGASRHRCAMSRAQRGPRIACSAQHAKRRSGGRRFSGPTAAVPRDRRSLSGPTRHATFSAAPGIRHARFGEPQSAAAPLGPILRCTGLPSRSALVAPPLRLAALRWRVASHFLARPRPPLGVSTAYFVAVARFSVTRFPRVPPLRMCPDRLGASAAHSQGLHARRCAPSSAPRRT
jgi:hypothetical protein